MIKIVLIPTNYLYGEFLLVGSFPNTLIGYFVIREFDIANSLVDFSKVSVRNLKTKGVSGMVGSVFYVQNSSSIHKYYTV